MKMKKVILVCLIMMMVLMNAFTCFAALDEGYLFEDDFKSYSLGVLPYGASQKWSDFSNRGFTQWTPNIAQDPRDNTNQVLAIDKNTVSATTKNEHLKTVQETINGQVEVSFRFYIPSDIRTANEKAYNSTSSNVGIVAGVVDSANAASFLVSTTIYPQKETTAQLNSHGQARSLTKDTWHTLKMTANTETGIRETYFDEEKIYTSAKVDTVEGKYMGELRFVVAGTLPESLMYVDDVKVEKVTKPWNYKIDKVYYADGTAYISGPKEGKSLSKVTLIKSEVADGNAVLAAAYYNQEGVMKAVKLVNFTANDFDESGEAELPVDMLFPNNAADITGGQIKVFLWDSMDNILPLEEAHLPNDSNVAPKLYLIGDSTMSEYKNKDYPRAGIGQMLTGYFNGIEVTNWGSSGKDTSDYLEYSGWKSILQNVKMGDYVLIQLGINDMIHDIGTDVCTQNLATMTDILVEKGVNVILSTPTIRRIFDDNGKFRATFDDNGELVSTDIYTSAKGDYLAAIKEFISQRKYAQGFFSVDMAGITAKMIGENGTFEDSSRQYYMQDAYYNWDSFYASDARATGSIYADKEGDNYKFCAGDYTHLTLYGADVIAQKLAKEIASLNIPLSDYIVNTEKVITYPNLEYTYAE